MYNRYLRVSYILSYSLIAEPDPPSKIYYIKDIHVYPFARNSKPDSTYLDAKVPWDPTNDLYKYIKKVWTNKEEFAATSFMVEESPSDTHLENFCKNKTKISMIKEIAEAKDSAKTIDIALGKDDLSKKIPTPSNKGEIKTWSCTGNLSEPCGGEKSFFCWQWIATKTGISIS